MTPQSMGSKLAPSVRPPLITLRMRLHAHIDGSGHADGVWWPRTQSLAAELPGLLTVLRPRLGPVRRVVYDPAGWSPSARHLQLGSRRILLDPYPFELFNAMYVCSAHGIVVALQVIPSTTAAGVADALLAAASHTPEVGASLASTPTTLR